MIDQALKKLSHKYKEYFQKHEKEILENFFTFLKFKTISADPSSDEEIQKCSNWICDFLLKSGFEVQKWRTSVNPVIFASHQASSSHRPTILFYHHYDVQPVDPLDQWKTDPFSPTIHQKQIYARGASDNKGQCYYTLCALKAFLEYGKKEDVNIKVLIDGEEEIGSHGLFEILKEKEDELKSDYTLIVDLSIPSLEKPAVTIGFRGIVTFDITCTGSNIDLHSGQFGGIAYNPLRALSAVLSKIWDEHGKVCINGFYDDVINCGTKHLVDADLNEIIDTFAIKPLHHEKGYSQLESNWTRPTCEINGLSGGYSGPGFKTVIPATAICKLSCRLVANQKPEHIEKIVAQFFEKHIPKGFDLKINVGHGASAFMASADTPFILKLQKAYLASLGKEAGLSMSGGSLPIASSLAKVSGGETLGVGFALDDDQIHAPNEHFGLDRLEYGMITIATLLELLAEEV